MRGYTELSRVDLNYPPPATLLSTSPSEHFILKLLYFKEYLHSFLRKKMKNNLLLIFLNYSGVNSGQFFLPFFLETRKAKLFFVSLNYFLKKWGEIKIM